MVLLRSMPRSISRTAALLPLLSGTLLSVTARAVPPHDPGLSTLDVRRNATTPAFLDVSWSVHDESLASSPAGTLTNEDRALRLECLRSMTARSLEIDRKIAESWSMRFEPSDSAFVLVGRFALATNVDRVSIEARIFDSLPRGHRVIVSDVAAGREHRGCLLDAEHPTCELALGPITASSSASTSTCRWTYLGASLGVVLTLFIYRFLFAQRTARGVPRPFDPTLPFFHERT
ncbi:MAG: hypothetical protein H6832_07360 [Planctomycetes bacterium]|nr:hypothetical protein [Planctomycetota bacterium]